MNKNKILVSIILATFIISTLAIAPTSAITVGTVSEWNLDEGTGSTAYDSTSNANNGQLSGGVFGNALEFDGLNDNVLVDGEPIELSGMSQLTLEAWINVKAYPTTTGPTGFAAIITKWYQSTSFDTYGLWVSNNGKLVGGLGPQIENGLYGTTTITLNTWHYVALVYDSTTGTAKLYLDNNLEATRTGLSGNLNSADNPLYIGCDYNGIAATPYNWRFFNGKIDELRISNTIHTITGKPTSAFSKEADTIALWHFDESTQNLVTSDSDIEHTGTINGATWAGPTWTDGYSGSALHFDGTDDMVIIPDDETLKPETITVDCYVRSSIAKTFAYILSKDYTTTFGASSYALYTGQNNGLKFYVKSNAGYKISPDAGSCVWDGEWHHVVGTFDGQDARLFVDNIEITGPIDGAGDIIYSPTGNLLFGQYSEVQTHPTYDFYYIGDLDEVKIYDYAIDDKLSIAFDDIYSQNVVAVNTDALLKVCVKDWIGNPAPSISIDLDAPEELTLNAQTPISGTDGCYAFTATSDAPGIYEITATIQTQLGPESATWQLVIYDPSEGFVTGGGWIMSPAGAYTADPELTGKANFGFVSKYKKGADVPTGNTAFVFEAAGLEFESTSYDWLVIAGNKAMFKGEGTINDEGTYKFMLSAIDGGKDGTDYFRIKIWDSEGTIYDNLLDAEDTADPTTAIGGGSIIVHKK